jgi:small subunit ribosomal protein S6e
MDLNDEMISLLLNKKIGDEIDGTALGLTGYKLKITGGTDSSGFPLEASISGQIKTKVIRERLNKNKEKINKRITVRGNVISSDVKQVSALITEYGSKPIEELFTAKKKEEENDKKN